MQRLKAFVHQLPPRRDSRRQPRCSGSRQLAADDLPALPRTGDTGAGAHVVLDWTGSERESDCYIGGAKVRGTLMAKRETTTRRQAKSRRETNVQRRERERKRWAIDQIARWIVWRIKRRRWTQQERKELEDVDKFLIDLMAKRDTWIESESIEN